IDTEVVYVSTIHKSKGREFDNLFILLRSFTPRTDEDKRQFYVAITRVKSLLSIHYNGNFLRPIVVDGLKYAEDRNTYPAPENLTICLTHRDVQLGYFEYVQHRLRNLYSGCALSLLEDGLGNSRNEPILRYSQNFASRISSFFEKGYSIFEARVNFIVYWKNVEGKESKIILPILLLKKALT